MVKIIWRSPFVGFFWGGENISFKTMKGSIREKFDNLYVSSHLYNFQVLALITCICVLLKFIW